MPVGRRVVWANAVLVALFSVGYGVQAIGASSDCECRWNLQVGGYMRSRIVRTVTLRSTQKAVVSRACVEACQGDCQVTVTTEFPSTPDETTVTPGADTRLESVSSSERTVTAVVVGACRKR